MTHSYLKTEVVYQGKNLPLGNTLKSSKGEMTSEAVHMNTLERLSTKVDWRSLESLQHSAEERKKLKKVKKEADNRFENVLAARIEG